MAVAAVAAGLLAPFAIPYDPPTRQTLVFVSDTQAPGFFETLWVKRDNNEEATRKVLAQAAREPGLAGAFMLGDLTRAASTDSNWETVDAFLARLKALNVPSYAAMGNHEYKWSSRKGEANFRKRFPELATLWYSVTFGPAAIIILNSNFDELSPEQVRAQAEFYADALAAFDADPAVRGILVCCHHAPFTNGTVVGPTKRVQTDFVPAFLKAPKGLLFLSGHAHAAEHFLEQGKDFLVLGGGGGLLHPCLTGNKCRYQDIFPVLDQRRMFHYVTVRVTEEGLDVTYQMLVMDFSKFLPVHEFTLKWPAAAGRPGPETGGR